MKEIVQIGTNILRQKAQPVPQALFGTTELTTMLLDMRTALESQKDGVAIAAPQIALPYRIFLISPRAYKKGTQHTPLIFINPIIIKKSKKTQMMPEGCLSVRWKYGEVKRAVNTTIEAHDENGIKFTRSGGGLLSQIFQHETDHLNGVLFIDTALNIGDHVPNHTHE